MSTTRLIRRRRGFSLLECLIYISVAGALLPFAVHSTYKAIQSKNAAQEHSQGLASLERLARQFRDDAREAMTATAADESKELVLTMPDDRQISYRVSDSAVERTLTGAKGAEAHDSFVLSSVKPAGVEVRTQPAEALLRFRVVRGQTEQDESDRPFIITASVGRNHRFDHK